MKMSNLLATMTMVCCFCDGAAACSGGGPSPSQDEIVKAEDTFMNDHSMIKRITAYKTMLRTSDKDFLRYAIGLGLSSENDALKATALRCKFLSSKTLTLKSLSFADSKSLDPNLSEKELKMVTEGVTVTFSVFYADAEKSCLSINAHYKKNCNPPYAAFVSDTSVSLVNDRPLQARFSLQSDGRLVGEISTWNGHGYNTIPGQLLLN